MASVEITYDGRLALTTAQAAVRYGLELATMRKALSRIELEPVADLDARTPLYDAAALDAAMAARPGKGARTDLREATDNPISGQ